MARRKTILGTQYDNNEADKLDLLHIKSLPYTYTFNDRLDFIFGRGCQDTCSFIYVDYFGQVSVLLLYISM